MRSYSVHENVNVKILMNSHISSPTENREVVFGILYVCLHIEVENICSEVTL
jgi:hypothetical protein